MRGPWLKLIQIKAHIYYAGLCSNGHGPKLIYRDSSDVHEEPSGPKEYKQLMRLVAVPDDLEFGKDGLWDRLHDKVCGPLMTKINIAYWETVPKSSPSHRSALFPTIEDCEPLKEVINNVSIILSLPISGLKTTMQGTMGPYFHVSLPSLLS